MNTAQASTSTDCDLKLYLDDKYISFLLTLVDKLEKIYFTGQSKLKDIYTSIDFACKNNIRINYVQTSKNIKKIEDIISEYKNLEEEVSEGIVLGYITQQKHPNAFKKLSAYIDYLNARI